MIDDIFAQRVFNKLDQLISEAKIAFDLLSPSSTEKFRVIEFHNNEPDETMEASLNYDGTVKILDVKNLTTAEKTRVIAQYPELAGKEIVE